MNPLTRQDTRPSIHSWWSDSNPGLRGPTINLHAAAKPLMKLMYHRQTLEFIRRNRGSPLSRDVLETYLSYLPWDYVSRGTKIVILSELTNRTESDVEARAVVDSPVFYYIAQMLWWPDIETRRASCVLLGNLASHECTALAILELDLCEQLVSLVGEEDSELTQAAQGALCHIAQRFEGAQAIVEAPVLDHVLELLESPRWAVRGRACNLVEKLAQHDSTLSAILKSKACVLLVSLLLDKHPEVVRSARNASSCIAQRLEDAPAIDVKTLDHILALLESSNPEVRIWACDRIGGFARRESTLPAMWESEVCVRVVSLLSDTHPRVFRSARNALSCIAQMLDDAPAIASKALDQVLALLESSNPEVRSWACDRVGGLAHHESSLPAILESRACLWVVSLLDDEHSGVIQSARNASSCIAQALELAPGVFVEVLDRGLELLESPSAEGRKWTCDLLDRLTNHKTILIAVSQSTACVRLVSRMRDENSQVCSSARNTLYSISQRLAGGPAFSKILGHILELLESPSPEVRRRTCDLVAKLALSEANVPAILKSTACARLVSVAAEEDSGPSQSATTALSQITRSLEGVQALVEALVLGRLLKLLSSPIVEVQLWTCDLLEMLARHRSTLPPILESRACVQLVSISHDTYSDIVRSALFVLTDIALKLEGAEAIVKAKVLDDISELLQSSSPEVRHWTCILVRALACHHFFARVILWSNTFVRLVSVLHDEHSKIILTAMLALCHIASGREAAQAIVYAKVLDEVSELIESSCWEVRQQTCILIQTLIHHEPILPAVLKSKACAWLLFLLYDERSEVVQSATKTLSQIAKTLEGAQVIVEAKALDDISELVESSCSKARQQSCILIQALIHHDSILPAVLQSKACAGLFSLLQDEHPKVVQSATKALSQIAEKLEGAQAIVEAKVCTLIKALVHHESILPAVLGSKACARLVAFLLREAATGTYPIFALSSLRAISQWPVGAAALIDMPAMFGGLEELCQSSNDVIQVVARSVLDDLARARSKQQIP